LAANAVTPLHLSGRITPKSGNDLNTIGTLFTNYLQGQSQTLSVQGDFVQPTGSSGTVQWLSTAFKTLTLQVTLPGQKFQVSCIGIIIYTRLHPVSDHSINHSE
jgi:hypothetical protein